MRSSAVRRALQGVASWEIWQYPRRVLSYLFFTYLLAVTALVGFSLWGPEADPSDWIFVAFAGAGIVLTQEIERRFGARRLQVGGDRMDVTFRLNDCWMVAAVLVAPLQAAVVVVACDYLHSLGRWFLHKHRHRSTVRSGGTVDRMPSHPHKTTFNASADTIALAAAAFIMVLLERTFGAVEISPVTYLLGALAALVAVMYLASSWFAVVLTLVTDRTWRESFRSLAHEQLKAVYAAALMGALLPLVWFSSTPVAVLFFFPVFIVFHQALLKSSIVDMSVVDETTGAANKRYWKTTARSCIDYATEGNLSFSVAVVDLDHFKKVNDTYGHLVGDVVLREVASRLKASVRATDLVGRFGGEEFVILLPDSDEAQALQIAERCRAALEDSPLAVGDDYEVRGTASIGVASSDSLTGGELEDFLKKADEALYMAKRSGRNTVIGPTALAISEQAVVTVLRTNAA